MRLLLAIDHSNTSDVAIEQVRHLPGHESIDLIVVTVISAVPFIDASAAGVPAGIGDILEEERQHFESRLAECMTRFDSDSFRSISGEVKIGAPGQVLTQLAQSKDADLVVMGAIGHSGLERLLLGSVSEYVATHAECSVLVIRPRVEEVSDPPSRILIALDGTNADSTLITWPGKLQLPPSTGIHLIHVMRLLSFYSPDVLAQATELWKQARTSNESHTRLLVGELKKSGFDATTSVNSGTHVGDQLLKYIDDHDSDLIVLGDHHRGALNRMFLGSVARDVLRHANCSVLVAR